MMQIEAWFGERALQVDAVTGQLEAALRVIDAGMRLLGSPKHLNELRAKTLELQDATAAGRLSLPWLALVPLSTIARF